ncbi:MAG: DUF3631 domain-containing protein [Acidobacteriaceae bacterium]|nr:DUF3631 domain-containing protein [Acidobacteriaceae bacterium]
MSQDNTITTDNPQATEPTRPDRSSDPEGWFLSHFREPMVGGDGFHMCFCPSHPDGAKHGNRSLQISRHGNKWLLRCFNLCDTPDIIAAAGLNMRDLFIDEPVIKAPSEPHTLEWARKIVADYEPKIAADPSCAFTADYVTAATVFSIEEGDTFDRLYEEIKNRGVRVSDWRWRVRQRDRELRKERSKIAEQRAKATEAAQSAEPPSWAPLDDACQQPVDGGELLGNLRKAILKFVHLDQDQATIVALWILFSWIFDKVAETNPFLRVVSPLPNCGKSTLLKVLRHLCRASWLVASSTRSAFTRKAQTARFTFLLDEADAFLQENEQFRNVLDGASDPDTANVAVSEKLGDQWHPTTIDCYVPMAIASIKLLYGMNTVEQRSIHIWLKRTTQAERKALTKARQRTLKAEFTPLTQQCARWATDNASALAGCYPELDFEDGRDEDVWQPIVAIADHIQPSLGKQVRDIAKAMIGTTSDTKETLAIKLLGDIKVLFDVKRGQQPKDLADKYKSETLCKDLAAMDGRPWHAMSTGKGRESKAIDQNRLARMLKDFGIAPHNIRINNDTPKGYKRKYFEDVWERYPSKSEDEDEPLTDPPNEGENASSADSSEAPTDEAKDTSSFSHTPRFDDSSRHTATTQRGVGENGNFEAATEQLCGGSKNGSNLNAENECGGVAGKNAENGDMKNNIDTFDPFSGPTDAHPRWRKRGLTDGSPDDPEEAEIDRLAGEDRWEDDK